MRTILVIDDSPEIAEAVSACMYDYNVISASDGIIGLDMLEEHYNEIDVVLLDINMPRFDGRASLLSIRNRFPNVPIRIFSAFVTNEVNLLATELTGRQAILKPIRLDDLRVEILQSTKEVIATVQRTGIMAYAQSLVTDLEQRSRTERPPARLLVCGSNSVIRDGIKSLINALGESLAYLETDVMNIRHFPRNYGLIIAVVTFQDFKIALDSKIPVICICFDLLEAIQAVNIIDESSDSLERVAIIVDKTERTESLFEYIRCAIRNLRDGQSYLPEQLKRPFITPDSERPLTINESRLMKYVLLGMETKTIARHLDNTPEAVRQLQYRLSKKIGRSGDDWLDWAQDWWKNNYP